MPRLGALICLVTLVAQPALGAIIYDNAAGMLTAPADDEGWSNTGFFDNADGGGVAIAPHYFLTAQHLGVGTAFNLNGTDYPLVNYYTIPGTDLGIGQVSGTLPHYATLYSGAGGTEVGKTISMVGWGHYAQGTALTTNSVQNGWYWTGNRAENWASNTVIATGSFSSTSNFLEFRFNPVSGSSMYTNHDSGGGNYIYNNNSWQLAGITYGITDYYTYNSSNQTYTPLSNPNNDTGVVVYNGAGLYVATAYDSMGNPTAYSPATTAETGNPTGAEDGYATEIAPYINQIDAITGLPEPGSIGLMLVTSVVMLAKRRRIFPRSRNDTPPNPRSD